MISFYQQLYLRTRLQPFCIYTFSKPHAKLNNGTVALWPHYGTGFVLASH
jgi:hypothetical protein